MNNPFELISSLDYEGLEAYLKVENINVLNEKNQNLLDAAIIYEFDDAFDLLIKNYINLNQRDYLGNTPIIYSILYNRIGYFKRLTREGANLNLSNNKGETPIMIALNQKKLDMAEILLDANVDLNQIDQNDENICFSIVRSHNLKLLKEIISKNKSLVHSINFTKRTLLHEACMVKDYDIALYLLNNGVLSNSADNFGETPLFFAVREKDYDIIKLLISFGALLEKKNGFFETVYDIAKDEILEYLKYQSLSVNYNKYLKKYPLHVAVILNDFVKVKQAINRYNTNKKDDFNYRPIEYAKLLKYTDIYNLLKLYEKNN